MSADIVFVRITVFLVYLIADALVDGLLFF